MSLASFTFGRPVQFPLGAFRAALDWTSRKGSFMARHNREARGVDQLGTLWRISYQPDWLSRVKISRQLPGDRRRSMVTLFRNPARRAEASPGRVVRTGISAVDGSADFRVSVEDPEGVVDSVIVVTRRKRGRKKEVVKYVLESRLPPPRR
ncbi:MAG: hypothetical protein M8866_12290 [marine benthic group bacterium]|jgi:hypothetical protein|nr:hypothetical protein [Candidatus Benthicola marisminoris]